MEFKPLAELRLKWQTRTASASPLPAAAERTGLIFATLPMSKTGSISDQGDHHVSRRAREGRVEMPA